MAVSIDPLKTGTSDEVNPTFTTLTVSGAGTFGGNVTTAGDFVTTGDQFIRSSNGGVIASGLLLKGSTGEIIPYFGSNPFGSWSGSGLAVTGSISATTSVTGASVVSTGVSINVAQSYTPPSATAGGTEGDIVWDSNYIYLCIAPDTWKRTPIATWP